MTSRRAEFFCRSKRPIELLVPPENLLGSPIRPICRGVESAYVGIEAEAEAELVSEV